MYEVETVKYWNFGIVMTVWDAGGQDKLRPLLKHYCQGTKILIWVVDANDTKHMKLSKDELHKMLIEPELKDVILLILANKQDLPNALSADEVQNELGMTYYHSQSPELLKSLRSATFFGMLPDGIIEIVSSYTPDIQCRPYYQGCLGSQTRCKVISTCGLNRDGIFEAMEWVQIQIKDAKLKHNNCIIL